MEIDKRLNLEHHVTEVLYIFPPGSVPQYGIDFLLIN